MREAIASAELGDEQVGEDPSVNALCARVARLLGKEDALFLPSGTMCNQIAFLVHCRPGDEAIAAESAHVISNEAGGPAALAGVRIHPVACARGIFDGSQVLGAVRPAKRNVPRASLVVVEQTTNRGGGAVWPLATLRDVRAAADKHGMAMHMDGARVLNASVASGVQPSAYGEVCDSLWLDLSKGLGCPVGAVLAGSADFVSRAWVWKQRLGGAMRQAGILAAAGLYALDHNVERLAEDHRNAAALAEGLSRIPWIRIDAASVETNLVFFDVAASGLSASDVAARLEKAGIGIGSEGATLMRAVTHLGIDAGQIEETLQQFGRLEI
jgi:threonine aldolase